MKMFQLLFYECQNKTMKYSTFYFKVSYIYLQFEHIIDFLSFCIKLFKLMQKRNYYIAKFVMPN